MIRRPGKPVRVILLGGGYASTWAYRALRRHLGRHAQITVVTPDPVHVFHGFTGEVLAGDLPVGASETPHHEVFSRARRISGRATRVDAAAQEVHVATPTGIEVLGYDHLLVATGAQEHTSAVPGMQEFGWPLRAAGNLDALLEHVERNLEAASPSEDPTGLFTIVVAGAGLAGSEASAALARRFRSRAGVRVLLVSASAEPAPELPARLRRRVARELAHEGVEVLSGRRVEEVTADAVLLDDGAAIATRTVVSTIGNRARVLPGLEHLPLAPDGRLVNTPELKLAPRVWAAGDVASVPRSHGRTAPTDALWAIRAGTHVGRNIARDALGLTPRPFRYLGLGRSAGFGPARGVSELYGVPFTGLTAWVLRVGFFLWFVPSRRHALRLVRSALRPAAPAIPAPRSELVLEPEKLPASSS